MGIMNGTTNFMLCKMEDEGAQYGEALKQAQVSSYWGAYLQFEYLTFFGQDLGFAEADPTADVEGHDVQVV